MNPSDSQSTTPPSPALLNLLAGVASGKHSVDQAAIEISGLNAAAKLGENGVASLDGAMVDLGREARCGFGEVVYGEGKTVELMQDIVQAQLDAGQNCFITRIDPTAAVQLRRSFQHTLHNPLGRTLRIGVDVGSLSDVKLDVAQPHVALVTAGSTDAAVAEEAAQTLGWMRVPYRRFDDIGVAGPQRLLAAVPGIRKASAVVVIAGMEGALPPTVAGHVAAPVIAVPTSTGYGANFAGVTPLMGMLTSCAANVAVVNIDAGFKGGYVAGMIAHSIAVAHKQPTNQS